MNGGDVVWLPWVGLATALLLLSAWWSLRRHNAAAALRRTGYAVALLGLWALGVPELVYRLWAAMSGWGARLLLSPLSWLGAIVTAIGVLFVIAGVAAGRRQAVRSSSGREHLQKSTVAVPAGNQPGKQVVVKSGAGKKGKQSSDEDDEIDAILRRHGIS